MLQSPTESPAISAEVETRPTRFDEMDLGPAMLQALVEAGYESPTPIQAALIPLALTGRDVLGQARTGTGKTAAFLVPLLDDIQVGLKDPEPQCLVLVPTRELAEQVHQECLKLSHGRKIRSLVVCGGKPLKRQMSMLAKGTDVVIGTPGRVIDVLRRGCLDLSYVDLVVLDEADRMLDIGFRPDIEKILRKCPTDRQTLLLSATVPDEVQQLGRRYMVDPEVINTSIGDVGHDTIDQYYIAVEPTEKYDHLLALLDREDPGSAIIFCRTKRGTDRLAMRLGKVFDRVAGIHGDLPQRKRDQIMERFRAGKVRFLVATDVLGRGIDVSDISHIINYDMPQDCDDYVHRVGRTGRMGRSGVAFTFVTRDEGKQLTSIEMRINKLLERVSLFDTPEPEVATNGDGETPTEGEPSKPGAFRKRGRRYRRAL